MSNRSISSKALFAWLCCGMIGPAAVAAARSSWPLVLAAGLLCSLLCVMIHSFSDSRVWQSKVYIVILIFWQIATAVMIARWAGQCWTGKYAEKVVPVVLLALAAYSARKGAGQAARVGAVMFPVCALIFAVILAAGVTSLKLDRVSVGAERLSPEMLVVFLLPVSATMLPRERTFGMVKVLLPLSITVALISVCVTGVVSLAVAITQEAAFYEFTKSLSLFGTVERFESVAAVGVTISIFSILSMLFAGIAHGINRFAPEKQQWGVGISFAAAVAATVLGIIPDGGHMGILAVVIWGFLPLIVQCVESGKNAKKEEKNT